MIQTRNPVEPRLAEKVFAIHDALESAAIPHAVGGAIDLVFCTENPRRTSDVDINIFLPVEQAERTLAALPAEIARGPADAKTIRDSGQVRLWWELTSVDLFFNNLPVHEEAARTRRIARLDGRELPILDVASLVTFKAMFDRPTDWRDIEMIIAGNRDTVAPAAARVAEMLGDDDPVTRRLNAMLGSSPDG